MVGRKSQRPPTLSSPLKWAHRFSFGRHMIGGRRATGARTSPKNVRRSADRPPWWPDGWGTAAAGWSSHETTWTTRCAKHAGRSRPVETHQWNQTWNSQWRMGNHVYYHELHIQVPRVWPQLGVCMCIKTGAVFFSNSCVVCYWITFYYSNHYFFRVTIVPSRVCFPCCCCLLLLNLSMWLVINVTDYYRRCAWWET